MFILALDGRAPLPNICETMRYNGETLVFNDEYKKIGEIDFEKCYYYGDDNAKKFSESQKSQDIIFVMIGSVLGLEKT